ncbi:hypothetical protein AB3K78_00170 [Leucobacter sp. HNU]|uniref:hypothetical protein n=1 Tax=Leucobacter sp. HNU TaxID=3236805 RepID=UPI003A7FD991
MINQISDHSELERIRRTARELMGPDSHYLSPEWLARDDIFCLPERNDNQGIHFDTTPMERVRRAMAPFRWYAAEVDDVDDPSNLIEVVDPVSHMFPGGHEESLSDFYTPRSYLLFNREKTAAILYSEEYEYRLIAGIDDFVLKYAGNVADFVAEFRDEMEHDERIWAKSGSQSWARYFMESIELAMSQVKIPPGAGEGAG